MYYQQQEATRLEANATRNKKLLGAPGITTRSKGATTVGAPGIATSNKKLVKLQRGDVMGCDFGCGEVCVVLSC